MAVSTSWFPNRPHVSVVDNHIIHEPANFVKTEHYGTTPNGIQNFLPYLLSLGLLSNNKPSSNYASSMAQEQTGPFKTHYYWNELDFAFDSPEERKTAIESGEFIKENNLPLGIEVYRDRLFVSMPKWKPGVPATLAVLPRVPIEPSPLMVPYPSWRWHVTGSCSRITSVFRMHVDVCGRLWVLDSGQIDITIKPKQICPPQVLIFNLQTDQLVKRYVLPDEFIKEDSLYSNIVVDIRDGDCDGAYAYLTDVWRYGLIVYNLKEDRGWRITDHLFFPEPLAAAYNLLGLDFEWTDGLFGLALSPYDPKAKDRILFFHPMSSFRQFYTLTSVIRNETGWQDIKDAFRVTGESRGKRGHTSASGMDRNGVHFHNLVSRSGVGCWDSRKPYKRQNLGLIAQSNVSLVFPNDLKIDNEFKQSVWVISNRLPFYLYRSLDKNDVNFRIMSAYIDDAIRGTICDPLYSFSGSFDEAEEDCY